MRSIYVFGQSLRLPIYFSVALSIVQYSCIVECINRPKRTGAALGGVQQTSGRSLRRRLVDVPRLRRATDVRRRRHSRHRLSSQRRSAVHARRCSQLQQLRQGRRLISEVASLGGAGGPPRVTPSRG